MARVGQRAEAAAAPETSSSEASAGQRAAATAAPQPSPPSSSQHTPEIDHVFARDLHTLLARMHLRGRPSVHELREVVYLDRVRALDFLERDGDWPSVPGVIFEARHSRRAELADTHIEGILEHALAAEICECRVAQRDPEPARLASMLWEWAARFITRI